MRSALAHRGSYVRIRLYDRVGKDNNGDGEPDAWVWQLVMESNRWMHNDNYVYGHIPYDSSRGYLPLAVGDYNGDSKEDLAFYCPAKADGAEAHVAVYSFTHNNGAWDHTDLGRINLKDFTPDYGRMNDPWHTWHLPTVALSTTSTRLGEVTKSAGAKQYKTYDDLVVSVSVPTEYRDDDLYLNSITKIFKYENDKFQSMFLHEYLPFGDEPDDKDRRMNYVNTVDADLNGDGFKEIVVAGYKEENLKKPNENQDDNRRYGDLVKGTNYINIITYAKDESGNLCYQMLWDKPKEINGQRNLSFYNAIEPIPICAGHYLYDTLGLKDQLCIQGIVFDCENSLISGAPVYTDQSDINYITDTQPYCDKQNFPDAVSFKNVYLFNLKDHVCDDDQKVINNCVSGRFFTGADVDQIVIISSDPVNDNSDQINIDISIISDVPGRQAFEPFSVKVYDDYFDSRIIHYDPKSSQMYSYTAHSLCYRLDDYTSDQGSVNDNRESTEMDFGDDVFVSSYYVDGYPDVLPPEPPEDFTVKSVRRNADGSADITLVWNSKNRNEYRKADGYNIYMSDKGSNLSLVHLVNRHSVIAPAGDYTAYTVHLEPGSYPEDEKINFYIAPAYVDDNTGGARIVTEGTLSAKASVGSVLDYTEGDLAIVAQPQNYYMTKDNNKETATFTIEAQRNLSGSDRVSFDWQRYDSGEGEWVSVQTDIIGNTGGDAPELCRSEYKLDIPGSDKDSFVETGVRCVAGYGSFSVPSDVATILYTDQKPAPADYYVVGTMNDWQVSDAYKLTRSTNVTDAEEYVLSNVSLTTEDSFLIVAAGSDKIATACYPANANRYGANGEIERSSKYTLRFRPHYDGDGWFHSCITAIDQRLYGDVDLSGTIDIQDATLLQRYLAEFEQLSTEQLACADANLDNQLNIRDVTHIQRLLVEAI